MHTIPANAPSSKDVCASYDATDYSDQHEAEQHAKSYSLTAAGLVNVNVHPMSYSPCVMFSKGAEVWRASDTEALAMAREGVRLLRQESAR